MGGGTISGEALLERLHELPGGAELLELAAGGGDVELIGGATRDLLLGRLPRELDVVVAADAPAFAGELARRLGRADGSDAIAGPNTTAHERFGTALVRWHDGRVDIATRRSESYPSPGALPEVRAGTAEEDLRRRDFTVNAIALVLGGPRKGELRSVTHALEDLSASRLRVLHARSFHDDPIRLLRLPRYGARLGFEPEQGTAELARQALGAGALSTVSGARLGAELRLALAEPEPASTFASLSTLGALGAIDPRLEFDELLARSALEALPVDGRPDLLLLAVLLLAMARQAEDPEPEMFGLLADLEFPAGDRDRVIRTVLLAPALVRELEAAATPSALRGAVHGAPLEALALAAALGERQPPGDAGAAARQWLLELRHVRLTITGDDLLAAGVPAGPEIGRRLQSALDMRLDGELDDTREAQLRAALEAPA